MTNIITLKLFKNKFSNPKRDVRYYDLSEPEQLKDGSWVIKEDLSCGRGYQPWYFRTYQDVEKFLNNVAQQTG